MVHSLVALFAFAGQQLPPPSLTEAQALAQVRTFLAGVYGEPLASEVIVQPSPYQGEENGSDGKYRFELPHQLQFGITETIGADVDAYTGKILGFSNRVLVSTQLVVTNPLQSSGWISGAERVRQAVGITDTFSLLGGRINYPEETFVSEPEGWAKFHRLRNGARLPDNGSEMVLCTQSSNGLIYSFTIDPIPDLEPLSTSINVTLQQARDLAAAAASQNVAFSESTDYPVALAWYFEEQHITFPDPMPSYLWLCKNVRPKLGYVGLFEYGSPVLDSLQWVIVEPDTGNIYTNPFSVKAGTFGEPKKLKFMPMMWDWEPGPIRIFNGVKSESIAKGTIPLAKPKKKPLASGEVLLQRGRLSVRCKVDRKAGLVWHQAGDKPVYGKPDATTMKAIAQLAVKKIDLRIKNRRR